MRLAGVEPHTRCSVMLCQLCHGLKRLPSGKAQEGTETPYPYRWPDPPSVARFSLRGALRRAAALHRIAGRMSRSNRRHGPQLCQPRARRQQEPTAPRASTQSDGAAQELAGYRGGGVNSEMLAATIIASDRHFSHRRGMRKCTAMRGGQDEADEPALTIARRRQSSRQQKCPRMLVVRSAVPAELESAP